MTILQLKLGGTLASPTRGVFAKHIAADWRARVISAGGTVADATYNAVAAFVQSASDAGYWAKINRMNLMCGNQLAAALVPLKVGGGAAVDAPTNFVSGDYTEATGLLGNGSSKYLDTGLNPSTALTANNTHLAVYNRSSATASGNYTMGAYTGGGAAFIGLAAPNSAGTGQAFQYDATAGGLLPAPSPLSTPYGMVVGSRTSSTYHAIYRNGAGLTSAVAAASGSLPNSSIFVFAAKGDGLPTGHVPAQLAGYSIGAGLTPGEVFLYYQHMQTFQTAMGRNV